MASASRQNRLKLQRRSLAREVFGPSRLIPVSFSGRLSEDEEERLVRLLTEPSEEPERPHPASMPGPAFIPFSHGSIVAFRTVGGSTGLRKGLPSLGVSSPDCPGQDQTGSCRGLFGRAE